jgi:hypothetical protein
MSNLTFKKIIVRQSTDTIIPVLYTHQLKGNPQLDAFTMGNARLLICSGGNSDYSVDIDMSVDGIRELRKALGDLLMEFNAEQKKLAAKK